MAVPAKTLANFLTAWLGLRTLGGAPSLARQIAAMEQVAPAQEACERERAAQDHGRTQGLLKMAGKLCHVLSVQNVAPALV